VTYRAASRLLPCASAPAASASTGSSCCLRRQRGEQAGRISTSLLLGRPREARHAAQLRAGEVTQNAPHSVRAVRWRALCDATQSPKERTPKDGFPEAQPTSHTTQRCSALCAQTPCRPPRRDEGEEGEGVRSDLKSMRSLNKERTQLRLRLRVEVARACSRGDAGLVSQLARQCTVQGTACHPFAAPLAARLAQRSLTGTRVAALTRCCLACSLGSSSPSSCALRRMP